MATEQTRRPELLTLVISSRERRWNGIFLRGHLVLRAQPTEGSVQALRGRLLLRAQPTEEQVQALLGGSIC
jgi:hypothetical protein